MDEVTQMLKNTPPAPVTWLPAQLKDDKAATKEALQKEKAAAAAAKKLQKDADAEANTKFVINFTAKVELALT